MIRNSTIQHDTVRRISANNSSVNLKLSETQLSNMIQSGGFLGRRLGPLMKVWLQWKKNVNTN